LSPGLPLWVGPGQQVRRVLRGGAFNNEERNVRCAARNRNNPNNWNRNNGFRLVASHDFPGRPEMPGGVQALCPLCRAEARKTAWLGPGRAPSESEGPGEYGLGSRKATPGDAPWVRPWGIPGWAYRIGSADSPGDKVAGLRSSAP